jgi:TatD DNase family protein
MVLVDSHAHLDGAEFDADRAEVVARARAAGLTRVVLIGLWRSVGNFGNSLELAKANPGFLFPTVGVHPHESGDVPPADWEELERLAENPLIVGVGETGLDYHYDHSPRAAQRAGFERQLALALRLGKPVSVHLREADEDALAMLGAARIGAGPGGVIHCFSGDRKAAEAFLALGLMLSISGIVTFKSAVLLQEAVAAIPLDRLLIETDCPFLTPVPFRGKRNEPAHVRLVAEKVAGLKGVTADEVGAASARNAERLFRLAG